MSDFDLTKLSSQSYFGIILVQHRYMMHQQGSSLPAPCKNTRRETVKAWVPVKYAGVPKTGKQQQVVVARGPTPSVVHLYKVRWLWCYEQYFSA